MNKITLVAASILAAFTTNAFAGDAELITPSHSNALGAKYAETLIENLKEGELAKIDVDDVVLGFKNALANSQLIKDQIDQRELTDSINRSRAQGESYFLQDAASYPMYQRSSHNYLFVVLAPKDGHAALSPGIKDGVVATLSAKSHEGIPYISEQEFKGLALNLPKAFKWAITEMSEGEKRRYIFPSWSMYGSKQYMEIPPFSSIIADIELKRVIPHTQ